MAKGGESEWVEGGEGREKKKVGGEPGGRVATHSGPSGGSAMRRVTLFLNGSPKNGKVRGSGGGEAGSAAGGEGSEVRSGRTGLRAEVGERGWERGGGRAPGWGASRRRRTSGPRGLLPTPGIPSPSLPLDSPAALGTSAQVNLCSVVPKSRCGSWRTEVSEGVGGPLSPDASIPLPTSPKTPLPPTPGYRRRRFPPSC